MTCFHELKSSFLPAPTTSSSFPDGLAAVGDRDDALAPPGEEGEKDQEQLERLLLLYYTLRPTVVRASPAPKAVGYKAL
jgi:hypothetical protein